MNMRLLSRSIFLFLVFLFLVMVKRGFAVTLEEVGAAVSTLATYKTNGSIRIYGYTGYNLATSGNILIRQVGSRVLLLAVIYIPFTILNNYYTAIYNSNFNLAYSSGVWGGSASYSGVYDSQINVLTWSVSGWSASAYVVNVPAREIPYKIDYDFLNVSDSGVQVGIGGGRSYYTGKAWSAISVQFVAGNYVANPNTFFVREDTAYYVVYGFRSNPTTPLNVVGRYVVFKNVQNVSSSGNLLDFLDSAKNQSGSTSSGQRYYDYQVVGDNVKISVAGEVKTFQDGTLDYISVPKINDSDIDAFIAEQGPSIGFGSGSGGSQTTTTEQTQTTQQTQTQTTQQTQTQTTQQTQTQTTQQTQTTTTIRVQDPPNLVDNEFVNRLFENLGNIHRKFPFSIIYDYVYLNSIIFNTQQKEFSDFLILLQDVINNNILSNFPFLHNVRISFAGINFDSYWNTFRLLNTILILMTLFISVRRLLWK